MNVSELAHRAGVTASAIRWYESAGILPPARRRPNGYREFDEADLARLRLIVSLRDLGVEPRAASRLTHAILGREGQAGGDLDLTPLVAAQRATIADRRAALDRVDRQLSDLEQTIGASGRAAVEAPAMTDRPIRVLFVCTGNSARSQIAEALLRRIGGAEFDVASAGTEPRGVNPYAVRVLAESGIDWSAARSKSVNEFLDEPFEYVVTVCDRAREACPVFPGRYNALHWSLDDPAAVEGTEEERLRAFRRTSLELVGRIRPFVELARRASRPTHTPAGPS